MIQQRFAGFAIGVFAVLFAVLAATQSAAAQKAGVPSVGTPQTQMAIADSQIKDILLLMSTDRHGDISEQEFVKFMRAEFNKLDRNQSGQVNARELVQVKPQVAPSSQFGK